MARIPLTQGLFATVDESDYDALMKWKWCALKGRHTFYAVRNNKVGGLKRPVRMHCVIAGSRPGEVVDHRDGNGLNNRRSNLVVTDKSGNGLNRVTLDRRNTSGFTGVFRDKTVKGWRAKVTFRKKPYHLGTFPSAKKASEAVSRFKKSLFNIK